MHKLLTVARYEFARNARRTSFLVLTFGVPLFGLIGVLVFRATSSPLAAGSATASIGYVDSGHLLPTEESQAGFIRFETADSARSALQQGRIGHYVVIPADYLKSGQVDLYSRQLSLGGEAPAEDAIQHFLAIGLAGKALPPQTAVRLATPPAYTIYLVSAGGDVRSLTTTGRRLVVGDLFSILLAVAVFSAAQFLLQGVTEEKENRVIEVLLSSASAEQLMEGKILGLGALGLLQVAFWTASVRFMAPLASGGLAALTAVAVSPGTLALLLLLFLLGYLFFAALLAAIGAVASSMREGQQIAGLVATLSLIPIWFAGALINQPSGGIARVLSYIPFTAPTALMQRIPTGQVSGAELASAILVLAIFVGLMMVAANRVFRMGLLLYGKRPGARAILAALRYGQ